ncbi:MAG: hypothetical protein KDD44_06980 [Bdellovibrionales bacterium]|nr:hypothetical protein [Bdellovibrionales bacterium]
MTPFLHHLFPDTPASLLVATLMLLPGCTGPDIPPGRILVRNDILDSSYNSFSIDRVRTDGGYLGYRKTLQPGESALLPVSGIRGIRFTRKYEHFARVYEVRCPPKLEGGIVMKLIDVHTGRLQGGCTLSRKGKRVAGVLHWEDE